MPGSLQLGLAWVLGVPHTPQAEHRQRWLENTPEQDMNGTGWLQFPEQDMNGTRWLQFPGLGVHVPEQPKSPALQAQSSIHQHLQGVQRCWTLMLKQTATQGQPLNTTALLELDGKSWPSCGGSA